jgi:hypothetical protein
MSVFDTMLSSAFRGFGMGGVYTPPGGGTANDVRVMWANPDQVEASFGIGVNTPARIAEIRVSQLALAEENGTLVVGGTTYRVTRASKPDPDRLVWRLELA